MREYLNINFINYFDYYFNNRDYLNNYLIINFDDFDKIIIKIEYFNK